MQDILQTIYYYLGEENAVKYLAQTWSQAKSSGIKLLEVHGVGKGLDPNIQPEKQVIKPIVDMKIKKNIPQTKPRLGQGRAGLRCKIKILMPIWINKTIVQKMENTQKMLAPNSTKAQDTIVLIPIPSYAILQCNILYMT